jgi:hypothetical protein
VFRRPEEECGTNSDADADSDTDGDTDSDSDGDSDSDSDGDSDTDVNSCPNDLQECPNGDADCNTDLFESCIGGCCYPQCEADVTPCGTSSDCESDKFCVTGCCISIIIV